MATPATPMNERPLTVVQVIPTCSRAAPSIMRSKSLVEMRRKLAEISRDLSADLLHAQSRAPAWSCLVANKISKVPFIATYDGSFSERNPVKRLYNSVMVRGARVIAPGERLAKMAEERYGTAREKFSVVPHAIDFEGVQSGASRIRWQRARSREPMGR
ncbi:MAG: glycosyltransferase [Rhizobiales bacterium]|nr:glycosyltransferase [Hyphomicrobiales bacterium]